jgi:hypothetical protein
VSRGGGGGGVEGRLGAWEGVIVPEWLDGWGIGRGTCSSPGYSDSDTFYVLSCSFSLSVALFLPLLLSYSHSYSQLHLPFSGSLPQSLFLPASMLLYFY